MPFVKEQLSPDMLLMSFIYTVGAVSVVLIVLALCFVDSGLVRRKNMLDTWVAKIVSAMIAGFGTMIAGVGIWNWQFNIAFGVPNPLWQALKDWWIGGQFLTHYSGELAFEKLPEADVQQVFAAFFITFSLGTLALIHTGAMERMRHKPLYVMALVIGAVLSPLVAFFCWGPVGPLSNHGTHDFDGIFPLYIFAGTWVLILSWRLGPRLGAFKPHPSGTQPAPNNVALVGAGVLLIMFALPFIAVASTWIAPEAGFFGISFTNTGLGIILENIFAAYIGGALVGAFLAYRRKDVQWALLGPLSGAVICGTMLDVAMPWVVFLISLLGPLVAIGTANLLKRVEIDEPKVIPLALGPGIVGALLCGFVEWGTKTGGYPGLKGAYALQHAEITPWWQLAGVVVTMLLAGIPCLLICLAFERTKGGLRISEAEELAGLDKTYWGIDNYGEEPALSLPNGGSIAEEDEPPVLARN
ncbi:MAG: ammonium transporter [Actinobacteria bacterium]|nr:ammonium transporter [Actinomycetota bacterium]